ncbi:MAG TPA: class I SAM-dependent methyltransferase [Nitrospira sp.]|nr:class I SAM-dependent methyltransferase [Nitrospira sp.]
MNTDSFPSVIKKILAYRRKSRVAFMRSKVTIAHQMNVVDIGCGVDGRSFDDYLPSHWHITGVDILPKERVHHYHPGFRYIQQDAQDLSRFKDHEFDWAVSIGMLEHITEDTTFKRIVSELRRVAKQYTVVVPYKYCWIEPHYGVPFFPLFPYAAKVATVKALNLSNHRDLVVNDPEYINKHFRWLSNRQYKTEFPDATIYLFPTLETIAITKAAQLKPDDRSNCLLCSAVY